MREGESHKSETNQSGQKAGELYRGGALNIPGSTHGTRRRKHFLGVPFAVYAAAVALTCWHLVPLWLGILTVPAGWVFTGNVGATPDYMQYRVWYDDTGNSGPIITNRFTTEPHKPYLFLPFFYLIAQSANIVGTGAEFIARYLGAACVGLFVILVFVAVREFLAAPHFRYSVFLVILLGGGMDIHLEQLRRLSMSFVHTRVVDLLPAGVDPAEVAFFHWHRLHYVIVVLSDSHFIVFWSLMTAVLLMLYFTMKRYSHWRLAATALLASLMTLFHLYEGVNVVIIVLTIAALLWSKKLMRRDVLVTVGAVIGSVGISFAWLLSVYGRSGLPYPQWRAPYVLTSALFLGYPLAWLLIAWGLPRYWREAKLRETFLLGWILGCVLITQSAPFYPFPDRGTTTLQIAVYLVAGTIFYQRFGRMKVVHGMIAIVALGLLPAKLVVDRWYSPVEWPEVPAIFLSPAHQSTLAFLSENATAEDVLMVDKAKNDNRADDTWLMPDYPGKLYCGHFFLTVDYPVKRREVQEFFGLPPERQSRFLAERGITWLFVGRERGVSDLEAVEGLTLVHSSEAGSLLRYEAARASQLQ